MTEFFPLLTVGSIIGVISVVFILAYAFMKDKKEAVGFDRHMKDSEIIKRLLAYAKPHWRQFLIVLLVMLFSIAYDIISPILVGNIEEMIKNDFELYALYLNVGFYASLLIVSMVCSYLQSIVSNESVLHIRWPKY